MMPVLPKHASRQKKYGRVCEQLQSLAFKLGPDAKLPTMVQLRDTLGVSIATLDNALRELESQKIIWRKHGVGIYVASDVSKPICLLTDITFFSQAGSSPFWNILLQQMRKRTARWNETVSFQIFSEQSPRIESLSDALISDLKYGRIQGILAVGLPVSARDKLIEMNVPHVVYAGLGACTVGHDIKTLIHSGITDLLEQDCRRIMIWKPQTMKRTSDWFQYERSRFENYLGKTLTAHRMPLASVGIEDSLALPEQENDPTFPTKSQQGFQMVQKMFGDPAVLPPDGILFTDDMMAVGALAAMQRMGIAIGKEVKIATHANAGSDVLIGQEDRITRLEFDPEELVDTMFAMLEAWMNGNKPENSHPEIQFHLRKSVREDSERHSSE